MHVVDLGVATQKATSRQDLLDATEGLWARVRDEMSPRDTLWVFSPHIDQGDSALPTAMAVGELAKDEAGLALKNIITRYKDPSGEGDLLNIQEEILFLVKNKREYVFNKDPIRVSHVYKGNEWGEDRETGRSSYHDTEVQRYNPEGKDPGNVWLEEVRDQTAGEALDETKPLPRNEAFRRCLLAGSNEGERIHFWVEGQEFDAMVQEEGRVPVYEDCSVIKEA